jgi:hypothetical protein
VQQNLWLKKKKTIMKWKFKQWWFVKGQAQKCDRIKRVMFHFKRVFAKKNSLALWLLSALLSSSDFSSHIFMPLNIDTYGLWTSIWSYLYVLRGIDITVFHTWGVHTNQYTTLAVISIPFSCNQRVIYNHLT